MYTDSTKLVKYFDITAVGKSRDLETLEPVFRASVENLIGKMADKHGQVMKPFVAYRSPMQQYIEWASSRSPLVIFNQAKKINDAGCTSVANMMTSAEMARTSGVWKSDALPFRSLHQYGLAVDLYHEITPGVAVWVGKAYDNLMIEAERLGLMSGGRFTKRDGVHVQSSQFDPAKRNTLGGFEFSWTEIEYLIQLSAKRLADSKPI